MCDFVCAKPLVVISINVENEGSNVLVFLNPRSGPGREVLVIGASVDAKNPAEGLDAVLKAEFVDGI